MKKPFIFITNDDGVSARGIWSIIEVCRRIGDVIAIAPEYSQSGKSHSITMYDPLYLRSVMDEEGCKVYGCSGTPVDCVKMGFDHLFAGTIPDIAVSGINHGSNSAINVLYSGTMGAAIEAGFYDCPSVGFSLDDHSVDADFAGAAHYGEIIIRKLLETKPELPLCLNVNIPAVPTDEIRGVKVCRQAQGYWRETFDCRQDPRGKDYFWLRGEFLNSEPESTDTDEWALKNNYISVVPIQTDLTNHKQISGLKSLLK